MVSSTVAIFQFPQTIKTFQTVLEHYSVLCVSERISPSSPKLSLSSSDGEEVSIERDAGNYVMRSGKINLHTENTI